MSNNNDRDFRPLGPGWYHTYYDKFDGSTDHYPVVGLIRDGEVWSMAEIDHELGGYTPARIEDHLVYRPDLAGLPGVLEIRVIDGVEYVRQSLPTTRRVLGPDTPFPTSKMEAN